MKKSTLVVLFIIMIGILILYLVSQKQNQPITPMSNEVNNEVNNEATTTEQTTLANPASVNCLEKGGTLEIRENKLGQYGVCLFEDNRQCEEWALFREECPVGGLKITGYQSDGEVYCAITGGQVEGLGTPTPMCKRVDGTLCNAQANLDGECPNPHDSNPNAGNTETP